MTDGEGSPDTSDGKPPTGPPRGEARSPVRRISIDGRTIWRGIGAVLATLLALWVAQRLATLLWIMAISIFLSLALEPGVRWLIARFGWKRGPAVGVLYLGGLVGLLLMVGILIPAIAGFADEVGDQGPEWIASLDEWTDDTFGFMVSDEVEAASATQDVEAFVGDWADEAFGTLSGIASAGASLVFALSTIAMFTFYFTADSPRYVRMVLSWFPPERQERIGWTLDEAIVQTGGYFYSRCLLMAINATGFVITMVVVGMPLTFAFPLALFGGFVSAFIPAIGTWLGAAVPILVTLAIEGLGAAAAVLVYVLAYQAIENSWLSPKISSESMSLSGSAAFGAAIAGGILAGPVGAFVALPTAALISSFAENYGTFYEVTYQSESTEDPTGLSTDPQPDGT